MEEVITKAEAKDLREKMGQIKDDVGRMLSSAKERVVEGTCEWTKSHPGASVAIVAAVAAGIGLTIGLMIGRSRD